MLDPEKRILLPADPGANYRAHRSEIDAAIQRVLDGGWYILGKEVAAFEDEFAKFLGGGGVVGVANGTDAVLLALRAAGVGPGDTVMTVSHTAVATVAAIELAGARPVLIDVDPVRYTMDPARLEAVLHHEVGRRAKALVVVHLYGHPADMHRLLPMAKAHGLVVIEDCAQCHGATLSGRVTGTWGDLAAFSFYPTKNLGALGDGGAVATTSEPMMERLRLLRQYGWRTRYLSEVAGLNSRLDEIQAAVLRVKLTYLAAENQRRQRIANHYSQALRQVPLVLPTVDAGATHVFHQYTVLSSERDQLAEALQSQGIGTAKLYPVPIHLQPAYRGRIALDPEGLAVTERIARELLCLPVHPHLSDEEVGGVVRGIQNYFGVGNEKENNKRDDQLDG